jgi:hypothetical protein
MRLAAIGRSLGRGRLFQWPNTVFFDRLVSFRELTRRSSPSKTTLKGSLKDDVALSNGYTVSKTLVRYLLLHKRSNAIVTHACFNRDLTGCKYLARHRILANVLDTTVA